MDYLRNRGDISACGRRVRFFVYSTDYTSTYMHTTNAPALRVEEVKKVYGNGVTALRGVSLTVSAGDFFALLGPNGAGKSTLINIVAGLVKKTSGYVAIEGRSIDGDHQAAKMHLGVVPQEFNFGIFEKVIDVVLDQAGYYGIARREALPRAKRLLTMLGLAEKMDQQSRLLSGGMKRRLMIARALVHEPDLLILDEPTAGVDIELRRDMWDFLSDLNQNHGVTIILTTHYLEEAEQLCRNVAIINQGGIVAQGEIKTLLGEMDEETFVVHCAERVSPSVKDMLALFDPVIDDREIELTISKEHDLQEAFAKLAQLQIKIVTMRNKTNRLEEFFIQKIKA